MQLRPVQKLNENENDLWKETAIRSSNPPHSCPTLEFE